jgi:nicotinamide-nucleotide amidase
MKAILVTIGDELLNGQTVNTNAAWLGAALTACGIELARIETVGDDPEAICQALRRARQEATLVVLCGGLGPTHDDRTREALAMCLNRPLQLREDLLAQIEAYFRQRQRAMPERNRVQALVPAGFEPLVNAVGTAPGLWLEDAQGVIVVLPGVPHEVEHLMQTAVLPRLARRADRQILQQRTLITAGIGESELQQRLEGIERLLDASLSLAYLPGPYGVRLRFTARAQDPEEARQRLKQAETFVRSRIAEVLVGTDSDTLESVVGQLLRAQGKTLAVAESCTGGHIADRITDVSGASAYFQGGIVAYSNTVKVVLLGVDPEILAREGAVSEAVAVQMAQGVRRHLQADLGLATTGIAGPTGGSAEKPVGTVWIGLADAQDAYARQYYLPGDRLRFKQRATAMALDLLRRHLLQAVTTVTQ